MAIPFKICGLTRLEDLLLAQELGAACLGVIMVPGTPRCVTLETARQLFAAARRPRVLVVGSLPLDEVQRLIDELRPEVVQLHRGEPPQFALALRNARIWRAFALRTAADVEAAAAYPAEAILADTGQGGTGRTCDWTLARQLSRRRRVILAGGITAANAHDAYIQSGASLLDCSSGVESAPGRKDPEKLRAFANTCNSAI